MEPCRDDVPPSICVFEKYWEDYDAWYAANREIAESEVMVVERSLRGAPRPIAEIGVGTGFFAYRLGMELGVDPAYNMLRVARSRGIEVVQGVGEHPPFRASSLGAAVIIVTLCFAPDPWGLVKEAVDTVRRGGRIISCIVPRDSPWGRRYLELARRGDPFYSVARFYTVGEVEEMYRQAGVKPRGCWSTLSYGPDDEPRLEKPWNTCRGGFVCIVGEKEV